MSPHALLDLCTELLRAVLKLDAPADGVVSAFFRRHRQLGARERHTLAETTYAVLRRRLRVQHLAQGGTGPLERRLAILAWQGGEAFLRGALSHDEQAWLAQTAKIDPVSLPDRQRHNLPDWLAGALREQVGDDQFWPLADALLEPAPLDLRVNTLKTKLADAQAALRDEGVATAPPRRGRRGACGSRASRR